MLPKEFVIALRAATEIPNRKEVWPAIERVLDRWFDRLDIVSLSDCAAIDVQPNPAAARMRNDALALRKLTDQLAQAGLQRGVVEGQDLGRDPRNDAYTTAFTIRVLRVYAAEPVVVLAKC